ncbi:MAG: M20/M25/M40 family metallo-hydrolase [Patescibacteria group bacterium]
MALNELDRFLAYAKVDTQSRKAAPGEEEQHPSSAGQAELASIVFQELCGIGVPEQQITRLGDGSLLVYLPPTEGCENKPTAAFAAHFDTYPASSGKVNPIIHDYAGGDIVLPNDGTVIPAADLAGFEGSQIVTGDGTSLLGGDDKAGVAGLMEAISRIIGEELPHGPLYIWLCVDEEIGKVGTDFLPEGVPDQWDIFLTVDGKGVDTVDIGCFNGAEAVFTFIGNDAHPGIDGDKLKPAHFVAARFVSTIATLQCPWDPADAEDSFYYAFFLGEPTPGRAVVQCVPRSFDLRDLDGMAKDLRGLAQEAADVFEVTLEGGELKVLYVSTEEAIAANPGLMEVVFAAVGANGYPLVKERVRAGTDGAMLNMKYPDIPAPNLGTGARNLHGVREFLAVREFETVVPTLLRIIAGFAEMG